MFCDSRGRGVPSMSRDRVHLRDTAITCASSKDVCIFLAAWTSWVHPPTQFSLSVLIPTFLWFNRVLSGESWILNWKSTAQERPFFIRAASASFKWAVVHWAVLRQTTSKKAWCIGTFTRRFRSSSSKRRDLTRHHYSQEIQSFAELNTPRRLSAKCHGHTQCRPPKNASSLTIQRDSETLSLHCMVTGGNPC